MKKKKKCLKQIIEKITMNKIKSKIKNYSNKIS